METHTIREGVLNDDLLHIITDDSKVFKGGYKAVIEYYTYANEWSDRVNFKRFRSLDRLHEYLDRNYKGYEVLA